MSDLHAFFRIPHFLLCLGVFLITHGSSALADDPLMESAVPLEYQVEGKPADNFRYAAVQCWLPPKKEIRGVLCIVLHPDGLNGRTLKDSKPWQALAFENGCALIGISIVSSGDPTKLWFEAGNGSGDALLGAISHFADISGRESLRNARVVLAGVCAAGQFSYEFAAFQPDRTAGFVTIGGAKHRLSIARYALHVPALLVPTPDRGPEAAANLESLLLLGDILKSQWRGAMGQISDYDAGYTQPVVSTFIKRTLRSISRELTAFESPSTGRVALSVKRRLVPELGDNTRFGHSESSPFLSFLGSPLPVCATVNNLKLEATQISSGNRMHADFSIRSGSVKAIDGIFLPDPLLSESTIRRLGNDEWHIDLVIDLDPIPSGTFSMEVPVRFSRERQSVLGGLQIPIQGTVTRDIYSLPKALRVDWTPDKCDAFVKLLSHSSRPIGVTWIECVQPAWMEATILRDSQGFQIIRISPKWGTSYLPETVAGYVLIRGTTNKEEKIKIPFYGTIKG